MTIISLGGTQKGIVGVKASKMQMRVTNGIPQAFQATGNFSSTRPVSRDSRVRVQTANAMHRTNILKHQMIGGSSNTININGLQHKQVNNFFNFTNPTTGGRNSAVHNQVASQNSTGLSIGTSNAVIVSSGARRGQTISHPAKQSDYANHYTTFTSNGTHKDGVRVSDVVTVGSHELNSTQNQKASEPVTASDIRQVKLNYLQLNKRSTGQQPKPSDDHLTTGRLPGKMGGQENEVERPFHDKLGATMQGFHKTKLDETLKTAKVRVNSEEHQDAQPAEAYDRNQERGTFKSASAIQETDDIEFCTPNSTIENLDNYIIGKRIGQGAYAVVRLGLHKELNQKIAVKIYEKLKLIEPNRKKSVKREMKIMEKLDHPNIAKLYEAFESPKQVFLIMEYVNGGSLHGYLKMKPNRQMPELEAKFLWRQVVQAIYYCHQRNVTHRDIKLENILLDETKTVAKLIDFGFSTCIPHERKVKIFCGTPSYMAPEIVSKIEYSGPPADIWALGVLLFALLCGKFPFRGQNDKELYTNIQR